jgi:hypothetical protein
MSNDNGTIFGKLSDLFGLRVDNPELFTTKEKALLDIAGNRPEKHGFTDSEKRGISDLWDRLICPICKGNCGLSCREEISDDLITSDNHEFQIGDSVGLLDRDGTVYHIIGFTGDRPIIQQAAFQTDKKNLWLRWAK